MNAKRLLRLADHLDTVPVEQFDILVIAESTTVACALGHAGLMTCFRRAGLKTDIGSGYITYTDRDGHTSCDLSAAEDFFSLSRTETTSLFSSTGYPSRPITPQMVARKIRKLVEDESKAKVTVK